MTPEVFTAAGSVGAIGLLLVANIRSKGVSKNTHGRAQNPGWVARRRAHAGVRHPKVGAAFGYGSAFHQVRLSPRELGLGGLILGAPGSGKTTAAAVLIEALAAQDIACVVLDPKPSKALAGVVGRVGGTIWTIGGDRCWDALPTDPTELSNQLVEVLPVDARTKVYRDAARLWVLIAGQALQRQGERPTVQRMTALCRREALAALLKAQGFSDDMPRLSSTEQDGVTSLGTSLAILARGAAGRSLGMGHDALRLEDAIGAGQIVLLQLAAGPYPEETRMLGAWALRSMLRLLRHPSPCVLICDEFARLGVQGRAAMDLLALGREFGKPVVLCTQGPSDFGDLGPHALAQAAQDASWLLAFRQGTRDSATASRLLGVRWAQERSWSRGSEAREHVKMVELPYVSASVLEDLEPGTAYLRVPSVDGRRTRVETVRVALPSAPDRLGKAGKPEKAGKPTQCIEPESDGLPNSSETETTEPEEAAGVPQIGQLEMPEFAREDQDEDLERVQRRLEDEGEQDGECRLWPEAGCNDQGYPKVSVGGSVVTVYKWLWEQANGGVPKRWTLDHACHTEAKARGECAGGKTCRHRRCCVLEHLVAMPHGENTQRRDEPAGAGTAEIQPKIGNSAAAETFAIALFAGIDRPAVEQRTVSLDELRQLLNTFEVLTEKRRGRCWSPTRYAGGASSRGNAGVAEVSALVFDLDRVPPDPERLAGVYWLGHTTWSHTPAAPRWRVVIPLTAPMPAESWRDVWQRARAALCPEADPSCKDPSRQYYFPAHSGGVTAKAACHDGPLLDPSTLPPMPAEPARAELRRSPTAKVLRRTTDSDRRRGEAYLAKVIDNLEATGPGGRNTALNAAAWTLGRWIAAGALDQRDVEDALYSTAETLNLVAEDGQRQCWATIRSGLGAGLGRLIDLDG